MPGNEGSAMSDPTCLAITDLQRALKARELSALEIADAYLAAGDRSTLNAYLDVQPELTRLQAREADAALAVSSASPLLGIPVAH